MARIHGKNGALYMSVTSAGTPEPIAYISEQSVGFATDKVDVTAFGDTNKAYVVGLPDPSGDFEGFYDTATPQMYTAAVDGIARKFYSYPTTAIAGTYFYGTAFFDFNVTWAVDSSVDITGSLTPAGPVTKIG